MWPMRGILGLTTGGSLGSILGESNHDRKSQTTVVPTPTISAVDFLRAETSATEAVVLLRFSIVALSENLFNHRGGSSLILC